MRIAIAQTPSGGNSGKNLARANTLAIQAGELGAKIVLFSELFAHSYDMELYGKAPQQNSFISQSLGINNIFKELKETAKTFGITILFGAATRETSASERLNNSIIGIFPGGEVAELYKKIHLWEGETRSFDVGDTGTVLDLDGYKIGLGICFDAGFPEFSSTYFEDNVDAILFSSAFLEGEQQVRYNIYHAARAVENNTYVAVSNAVGKTGEGTFFGQGYAVDPFGNEIFRLGDADAVAVFDIDKALRIRAREELPFQRDNSQISHVHHKKIH